MLLTWDTKSQLDRLKAQWRKEWEAELAEKQRRDSKRILESINAKLDKMKERKMQGEALEEDGEE